LVTRSKRSLSPNHSTPPISAQKIDSASEAMIT
jgi:hypothetical protein